MVISTKASLIALSMLVPFAFTSAGMAKNNGKSGNGKIRVEADLEAPALIPVEGDGEGDARYEERIHKGVSKTKRFQAKVRIPVSNSSPLGIIDEAAAQNADVQLVLSHGLDALEPTPYATCILQLTEIEQELEDGVPVSVAVYKVDVRSELRGRSQRQRQIHGGCDIDVATAELQNGTPVVADGDTLDAVLLTAPVAPAVEPTVTPIVSGTFATKF
jgi:hypothetical protein